MESVKYLSIAEFAEAASVSKQAIYKQVNNANSQLAPYLLRDGKRTLISAAALTELYKVEIENSTLATLHDGRSERRSTLEVEDTTQDTTPRVDEVEEVATQNQPNSTPDSQPVSTDYIDFLKAEIAELKADKEQREQRFNDTIREKDEIIRQQTEQLASLAQQVADIASKAIITTSQQQYLTAAEKLDKQEPAEEAATDGNEVIEVKQEKKSFWQRLFG